MSETYKTNISTFDDSQSEEFLALLRNVKFAIDRPIMTTALCRINYPRTILRGTSLRGVDELALAGNSTNNHLKHTTEVLVDYLPP